MNRRRVARPLRRDTVLAWEQRLFRLPIPILFQMWVP